MLKSAARAAENTTARITSHDLEQLKLWLEGRAGEIEENCRKGLLAEIAAVTTQLKEELTSVLNSLADQLRDDNLKEMATRLEEPVRRIGDLIATLERASTRADEKLDELAFRAGQVQKLIQIQDQQNHTLETLVKRGESAAERLRAATEGGSTFLEIQAKRWKRSQLVFSLMILLMICLGTYLQARIYRPTWLTIEESNYWKLLTEDMKAEERERLMQRLNAKQRQMEQQNSTTP
jgi:hypothetical protein